jgi:hypothetical protein
MTHASRRQLGLILGLLLGAGFSITSNMINRWTLPDINLFVNWPGPFVLILVSTALFGLLGLIAAWPQETLPGVILAGLAGSLLSSLWIAISETANRTGTFFVLFIVFLPRVFLYAPFGLLVRWLVDRIEFNPARPQAPARRLLPVIVTFIIFAMMGLSSRFSEEERLSLTRMEALIQEGRQASSFDELPEPLKDVIGFRERAKGNYTFQFGRDPDVLPVQRPFVDYGEAEPFLIIRFESGFRFGCVFSPPYIVPACIDF